MRAESDSNQPALAGRPFEVTLDGRIIQLPPQRRSLAAVRAYLETVALEQQRILVGLKVDGEAISLNGALIGEESFARVEAETIDLSQVPLQLVKTALQQSKRVRSHALTAISLVLINDESEARAIWWDLAQELKQPLLTLSLMPLDACKTSKGSASLLQLRKWQLEQLASILKAVDARAASDDNIRLSEAIEERVMPWLDGLMATLDLWQATLLVSQHTHVFGL